MDNKKLLLLAKEKRNHYLSETYESEFAYQYTRGCIDTLEWLISKLDGEYKIKQPLFHIAKDGTVTAKACE